MKRKLALPAFFAGRNFVIVYFCLVAGIHCGNEGINLAASIGAEDDGSAARIIDAGDLQRFLQFLQCELPSRDEIASRPRRC